MSVRTVSVAGGNWNDTNAWDEAAVPIAGDDVVARGGGDSGNLTVNVLSACDSIDFTNYTGTFELDANITFNDSVTLVVGMTFTPNAQIVTLAGGGTLTSAGKAYNSVYFSGANTYTLADDLDVNGALTVASAITVNGNQIKAGGNFTTNGVLSGTTTLLVDGTGNWASNGSAIETTNMIINTAGTLTLSGSFCVFGSNGTLTYITGTIAGSTQLYLTASFEGVLDTSGMTWPLVIVATAKTFTLASDLNVVDIVINKAGNSTCNGNTINVTGDFTQTAGNFIGTSVLNIAGSTDQNITGSVTYYLGMTITINSSGGIVYMKGTLGFYNGKTFTRISGTVDCSTFSHTLKLLNSCILNTNGIDWNDVTVVGTGTYTLLSDLSIDGDMTINSAKVMTIAGSGNIIASGNWSNSGTFNHGNNKVIFDKSSGILTIDGSNSFYTLECQVAGLRVEFDNTATQSVAGDLTLVGADGNNLILRTDVGGNLWSLNWTGIVSTVQFVDVQDSDASGAKMIDARTNCINSGSNEHWKFIKENSVLYATNF